jgi:hypothetical protein
MLESRMTWMRGLAAAVVGLLALSACNMEGPAVAGVPGLQWQIQRFYLDRATEEGGMCTAPAIRSITQTTVLEDTEEQLVLRVRYFWRDEGMQPDFDRLPLISAVSCQGFAERDFTLARMTDGSLQVTGMTGEMRNVRQNFGTRSGGS